MFTCVFCYLHEIYKHYSVSVICGTPEDENTTAKISGFIMCLILFLKNT